MRYLILLAAVAAASTAQNQRPPLRVPESVEVRPGLVYASPGAHDLHLDLYLPKSGAGPFPAVVYVHGGGWRGGNRNQFARHAAHMATLGFAGATIQYRLSGQAKYPAAFEDVQAAVRWLRKNAAEYRIDPGRIGAAGGSAGGHLVALLGTRADPEARVQAVAAFNPVLDFVSLGPKSASKAEGAISSFLGAAYSERPDLWKEASPIEHISKQTAPMLLLHGTADATVPYSQSEDMLKRLRAAKVPAELFTAPGAGHGFFNSEPHFQPALKRMEDFFRARLK
jgi:acetyl esterase/lipase